MIKRLLLGFSLVNCMAIHTVPNEDQIAKQKLEAQKKENKSEMYEMLKEIYKWRDRFNSNSNGPEKEKAYEMLCTLYIKAHQLQAAARNIGTDQLSEYRVLSK